MAGQLVKPPTSLLRPIPARPSQVRGLSSSEWFGPLEPVKPVAPLGMQPRQFEFLPGQNLVFQPRAAEAISFQDLIYMADNCDLVRIVIEALKDSVCLLPWQVRMRQMPGETEKQRGLRSQSDPRVQYWSDLLAWPNQTQSWCDWLRMLLEDLFVLDAPSILVQRNRKADIGALRIIDGQTINRIIDDNGFTPLPPNPAYQQILYGLPAVDLTTEDLIYRPRNQRARTLYGFSPVEQILLTLNIALRRSRFQLAAYTEGNVPEALYTMPSSVNEEQVKRFQSWFDLQLAGNLQHRRRIWFIPGDDKGVNRLHFTKDALIKDEADEWFARVIAFAFRVSPKELTRMMNRATAESSEDSAQEMGVQSVCQWIADTLNYIIQRQEGDEEIEFTFAQRREPDALKQAQTDQVYLGAGVRTRNEVREYLGDEPSDDPAANVLTSSGPLVAIDSVLQSQQPPGGGQPGQPGGAFNPDVINGQPAESAGGPGAEAEGQEGENEAPEPKANEQQKAAGMDDLSTLSDEELKTIILLAEKNGAVAKASGSDDDDKDEDDDEKLTEDDYNLLFEHMTGAELRELFDATEAGDDDEKNAAASAEELAKFEEDEHPRAPAGSHTGGKFVEKPGKKSRHLPGVVDRHTLSGGQGQGMKWIRPPKRLGIYIRDKFRCAYCQTDKDTITLDHLIPHSKGGPHSADNLVTCCKKCNDRRRDMPIEQFIDRYFPGKKKAILARIEKSTGAAVELDRGKAALANRKWHAAIQYAKKKWGSLAAAAKTLLREFYYQEPNADESQ
jgi:hypothetical protein